MASGQIQTSESASSDLPTVEIRPEAGLDTIRHAIRDIWRRRAQTRSLAWRIFLRDMNAMFRQSVLGYAWLVLPPLANTLIWILLTAQKVVAIETPGTPYALFVLTGNVLWAAFSGAFLGVLGSVNESRAVLAKVNFPHEAIILSALGKTSVAAIIPGLLLLPALIVFKVHPSAGQLLFLPGLLALILLGAAAALVLVPIATLFSDVGRGAQLGLRLLFFLSPVVYPLPQAALMAELMRWNPVAPLIVTARHALIGGEGCLSLAWLVVVLASVALLLIGTIILKLAMPRLIERIGG